MHLLELYPLARTALRWSIEHDAVPDRANAIVAMLWGLIHQSHTREITELGQAVLDRWNDPGSPLWADAVATVATGMYLRGQPGEATELAEAAMAHVGESRTAPVTLLRVRAQAAQSVGDRRRAIELFEAGAARARELETIGWALEADAARAAMMMHEGEADEALQLVRATIAESATIGSTITTLWARGVEGMILVERDPRAAIATAEATIAESIEVGYPAGAPRAGYARARALIPARRSRCGGGGDPRADRIAAPARIARALPDARAYGGPAAQREAHRAPRRHRRDLADTARPQHGGGRGPRAADEQRPGARTRRARERDARRAPQGHGPDRADPHAKRVVDRRSRHSSARATTGRSTTRAAACSSSTARGSRTSPCCSRAPAARSTVSS